MKHFLFTALFTPEMETYTVMETQKEREVCFTSTTTHLMMALQIITHDDTAIGRCNGQFILHELLYFISLQVILTMFLSMKLFHSRVIFLSVWTY